VSGQYPALITVSFGSLFTIVPQVSAVMTGISNPSADLDNYIAWNVQIEGTSLTGTTITVIPSANFDYLKLKWVAAQGDTLQVFLLSASLTDTGDDGGYHYPATLNISFPDANQVQFDPNNLPSGVVVFTIFTSFSAIQSGVFQYDEVALQPYLNSTVFDADHGYILYASLLGPGNLIDPVGGTLAVVYWTHGTTW